MSWANTQYTRADEISTTNSSDQRTNTRQGTRSEQFGNNIVSDFTGTHSALANYSVVGINATKANKAADDMVTASGKVMDKIAEIEVDTTTLDGAFKGDEVQRAFKNYIDKVKLYCEATISDINAFADKLYEVGEVWKKGSEAFATNSIDEAASASFSNGTTDFYQNQKASGASAAPGGRS